MLDDLRNYLQMASGLTEATTAKAKEVVTGLISTGISTGMSLSSKAGPAPEMMGQVQELADDLVATSRNNRDMLTAMIRSEVDKAVGRMGFVREDELAALRRHVQRLEQQVAELRDAAPAAQAAPTPPAPTSPASTPPTQAPVAAESVWPTPTPDEADAIADAAGQTPAEEPAPAESPVAADAPADVVGEAAEPVKKKKKKILIDPSAGA